jgi:hypothetical protein
VLFQGGKQSRVAPLLVLLQTECLAKRADAIADGLLPVVSCPAMFPRLAAWFA